MTPTLQDEYEVEEVMMRWACFARPEARHRDVEGGDTEDETLNPFC